MSRTERKHVDDGRDLGVRLTEKTADALKKSLRSLPARRASATKHQTQSTIRTIRTMGDRHIGEALHAPGPTPTPRSSRTTSTPSTSTSCHYNSAASTRRSGAPRPWKPGSPTRFTTWNG